MNYTQLNMTDCDCNILDGGHCERHGIRKTAHWVELCRRRGEYWRAWEEGRGPSQAQTTSRKNGHPTSGRVVAAGPGTELKRILLGFGIKPGCGCDCARMARQMNSWGPDGCERRLDTIVDHLEKEAKRRRLPIPFRRTLARLLVRRAIRKARKAESPQ